MPFNYRTIFILILSVLPSAFTHAQQPASALFSLVSPASSHIYFNNQITESETLNLISYQYLYNGGGVAMGDLNNDGLPEIYFAGNMTGDKLYLNKGNFLFEDISDQSGIVKNTDPMAVGWSSGVTMADINADGLLDIYVCKSGKYPEDERRNKLFINNGNLTFTEQSNQFGIDDPAYSTQASFFDYDLDGDLDLFLLNHCLNQQKNFIVDEVRKQRDPFGGNKLYKNENGFFKDVSAEAGIDGSPLNFGLGIITGDFNNDLLPDIFVTNDFQERDFLYFNNGNGTFTEKLTSSFQHTSQFSMGADLADINHDGFPDLIVCDMLPEDNHRQKLLKGPSRYDAYQLAVDYGLYHQVMRNTLQINNGDGSYSEIGQFAGVSATDWSWAPLFADFDNDGYQDLYITNGFRRDFTNMDFIKYTYADEEKKAAEAGKPINYYELIQKMPSVKLPNYMYKGNASLQFENKINDWGFGQASFSNGAAYGDLDSDGDLDLAVNNINDTAFIYQNHANEISKNKFLEFKITGAGKNIFAIGTKIIVTADGKIFMREITPTRGYQSSVDYKIIIGLGEIAFADIEILFPSGKSIVFKKHPTSSTITADEKDAVFIKKENRIQPLFTDVTSSWKLIHTDLEENYIDFKREVLLPHKLSEPGPEMAAGDVNGDHLPDLFIGGSKNKKARLYIQDEEGKFFPLLNSPWNADSAYEDAGICMFDADGDKDNDIYVTSGGNEFENNSPFYQDRLYMNDGSGSFSKAINALPQINISKSCVRAADFDDDGDMDLFVGGKLISGKYPLAPQSFLFENISSDGNVLFKNVTSAICPGLLNAGMVNDAIWVDLNKDDRKDLIVVGEWMPVRIYLNTKTGFKDATDQFGLKNTTGWWNCIQSGDFDNDGDPDFIIGNRGLNNRIHASVNQPASIYISDFDRNGSLDPVFCYYFNDGKSHPVASRDDLLDQVNPLRKKFIYYADYADATIESIFPKADFTTVPVFKTEEFASVYLENNKGAFEIKQLPPEAQWSSINCMAIKDFNSDGNLDVILAGNDLGMVPELGRMDAGTGLLMLGDGKGNFIPQSAMQSGIKILGQACNMQIMKLQSETYIVISKNKMPVQVVMLNE